MVLVFGSQLEGRKSSRAAIVPYTAVELKNGEMEMQFLLGVHADSGDLSDFGGGIKKYEFDVTGGIRELHEESKGIFANTITPNTVGTCVAAYHPDPATRHRLWGDGGMSVIFVPVDKKWIDTAQSLFEQSELVGGAYDEISKLVWLGETDFLDLIHNVGEKDPGGAYTMWSRLRRFYSAIYTDELRSLLMTRYEWMNPPANQV